MPDDTPPPRASRVPDRDRDDDRPQRDRRDDDYHPRGEDAKYDEDGNEITQNDIMWGLFAHIGPFLLGVFAPLIILLAMGGKSPFIRRHARESLNHIITLMLIEFVVMAVAAAVGYGVYVSYQDWLIALIVFEGVLFLLILPVGITSLVYMVKAAIAASKGKEYRYRFSLRLIG